MTTIYSNKEKTKFVHCNDEKSTIFTIRIKTNGAEIATIEGKEAAKMIQDLHFDLKYNFDGNALQICQASDFAEAYLEAQRKQANVLNSINQSLYQTA